MYNMYGHLKGMDFFITVYCRQSCRSRSKRTGPSLGWRTVHAKCLCIFERKFVRDLLYTIHYIYIYEFGAWSVPEFGAWNRHTGQMSKCSLKMCSLALCYWIQMQLLGLFVPPPNHGTLLEKHWINSVNNNKKGHFNINEKMLVLLLKEVPLSVNNYDFKNVILSISVWHILSRQISHKYHTLGG